MTTPAIPQDGWDWHIITCEYPPRIGGVSDYTFTLASSLGAARTTHVWCPTSEAGAIPEAAGTIVHSDLGRFSLPDLIRVGRQLNASPAPRRLFVQWVPQGFGYRSVNVWFALWLACRALIRHDQLHLMIHEPFLPLSRSPMRLGVALVQRAMLAVAAVGATRIWLSTANWRERVRPFLPARTPLAWLPVPARLSVGRPMVTLEPTQTPLVVGHLGTHTRLVTPLLASALDVVLARTTAHVLLIGQGSEEFRASYVRDHPSFADRIEATGAIAFERLAACIDRCSVMIQPYPDGVTSRRTSTLTLLARGKPVVTNHGELTEDFWSARQAVALLARPDGHLLGQEAIWLLDDRAGRAALSQRALALYDEMFDCRHAVAALEGAA